MRPALARWIGDADALRYQEQLAVGIPTLDLGHLTARPDDYYIALVGELFNRLRDGYTDRNDWARLGNALALYASGLDEDRIENRGVRPEEARMLAATAFYTGGFPASALLTLREGRFERGDTLTDACVDLLARPSAIRSDIVRQLVQALRAGNMEVIHRAVVDLGALADAALHTGPAEWIRTRLLHRLVERFRDTNIRAILPDGSSAFWNPFVDSLLADRSPAAWDFFPSQIDAIQKGLLTRAESFSLQMPTGAGKTALCEALLFRELHANPSAAAILLVPYRSLAAELRGSVVKRLNRLGILARCAYGGTVPTGDEVRSLADTRVLVATPESLSGLLSADADFLRRISLVICDEGHLLDSEGRGVGLELLLARLRGREANPPRFVFLSAIVPNIEEINAWLGGNDETVARSDYRPAIAEYAVLRSQGRGTAAELSLEMHPHEVPPVRFSLREFLTARDFRYVNRATGRRNTRPYESLKTRAVATARKCLPLGAVALFAANKRGHSGAIGLAEELLDQLTVDLPLPMPPLSDEAGYVSDIVEYLSNEYGAGWVGTRAFAHGAVLHHGDIPQETREALETAVRHGLIKFAICTSTLAEGVNLPFRTIVLYSVNRTLPSGKATAMLTRDIKNLVGRAGRAGATTKGLVICANDEQWPLVERVARQEGGERVAGALFSLLRDVTEALRSLPGGLSNEVMENSPALYHLIDGVDSTIVDLATEELSEDALVALALRLVDQTFAYRQSDGASQRTLEDVFSLRARRVHAVQMQGRLGWIRETGCRTRILNSVERDLLPSWNGWEEVVDAVDPVFVDVLLEWAWRQPDMAQPLNEAYRIKPGASIETWKRSYFALVHAWLRGDPFAAIAQAATLDVDSALAVYTKALSYALQTLVEQAIPMVIRLREEQGFTTSESVARFPSHLRFGLPTSAGWLLMQAGVRHRRAAAALSQEEAVTNLEWAGPEAMVIEASSLLDENEHVWTERLGRFILRNTQLDLRESL